MKAWILKSQSPIEIKDNNLIWQERSIISLAYISRKDGVEFLQLANDINIKTCIEVFPFENLPEVLIQVKNGKINGNAVIEIQKIANPFA